MSNRNYGVATRPEIDLEPRVLFTAPWEPIVVRRGDALGLRALTDQFADAIAPDLSNRINDGRWVTILAWCLARSHQVFSATRARSVATRAEPRERYAWLRPIELMWVARTIALAHEDWRDRPLSGRRRVRPWYEDDFQQTDRFGMSEDQFRAYRQTGMYGGYRVGFRRWPGMTKQGDGWTPGPTTLELARWLDKRLGTARPRWPLHLGYGDEGGFPAPDSRSLGKEHLWWLRQWRTFDKGGPSAEQNTLPRRRDDDSRLPEADLLTPPLFGDNENGKQRRKVALEVGKSRAGNHLEVCDHLGRVFANNPTIGLLPQFSRLADAGMGAMDLVTESLRNDARVKLVDTAAHPDASRICRELKAAAAGWLKNTHMQLRHIEAAHRFAGSIPSARPVECLGALLKHHEACGGGLRWFVLRDDWVEPRTPWRPGSSRYRFRLWSLCRLAAQCGVLRNMPRALLGDIEATEEKETTDSTDE
jgi:hypothetical protein